MTRKHIFNQFSAEERAEIDALIHQAYTDADGMPRTHAEAADEFDSLLTTAVQSHREWAGILLDHWRFEGMKSFIADRYKHSELFEFTRRDRKVSRTARRGTQRTDESGAEKWVQLQFHDWTVFDLRAAIAREEQAISERQTNIAMYRALVDLIQETGASTVGEALTQRGQTIGEFLDERLAS